MNVEVFAKHFAVIGEGCLWDDRNNRLVWIDLLGNKILWCDADNPQDVQEWDVGQNTGFIGLREQGGYVAGLQHGFYEVDLEKRTMIPIIDPENDVPNNRFNDGKPGPDGSVWAGTMSKDLDTGKGDMTPRGKLYKLAADHSCHVVKEHVMISNGLAWAMDQKTMYYIDSPTRTVVAYDFDAEKGEASNPRIVIRTTEEMGSPDGMTIDTEGKLWISHWGGSCVRRWDPETGMVLSKIDLPVSQVACCCFGGKNMDKLFVVSATVTFTKEDMEREPLAGSVLVVEPGVKGLPAYRYKG